MAELFPRVNPGDRVSASLENQQSEALERMAATLDEWPWLLPVATQSELPDPSIARDGDVALTLDSRKLWAWNETLGKWENVGGGGPFKDLVADFGLRGGGLAADGLANLMAMRTALEWARDNKGTLLAPPGVYVLGRSGDPAGNPADRSPAAEALRDASLFLYSNTRIVGAGLGATVFKLAPNWTPKRYHVALFATNRDKFNGSGGPLTFGQAYERVYVEGITFDGNGSAQSHAFVAIGVYSGKHWRITDCEFTGWGLDGVQLSIATSGGLRVSDECELVTVDNCLFRKNNRGGVAIVGGKRCLVAFNTMEDCSLFGCDIEPFTNSQCDRNRIMGNLMLRCGGGKKVWPGIAMSEADYGGDNHAYFHPAIQILAEHQIYLRKNTTAASTVLYVSDNKGLNPGQEIILSQDLIDVKAFVAEGTGAITWNAGQALWVVQLKKPLGRAFTVESAGATPATVSSETTGSTRYNQVVGNLIDGAGLSGIRVWYADYTRLEGNTVLNAGKLNQVQVSHIVQAGNTPSVVATALAAAINAHPDLQMTQWPDGGDPGPGEVTPIGVKATATGGDVSLEALVAGTNGNQLHYSIASQLGTSNVSNLWDTQVGVTTQTLTGGASGVKATGKASIASVVVGDVITMTFEAAYGSNHGVYPYYSRNVEIVGNLIKGSSDNGLNIAGASHNAFVMNNLITENGQDGVYVGSQFNLLLSNRSTDNGTKRGLVSRFVWNGYNVVASNNALFNNLATDTRYSQGSAFTSQRRGMVISGGFCTLVSNACEGHYNGVISEASSSLTNYRLGNKGIDALDGTLGFGRAVIGTEVRHTTGAGGSTTGTGPYVTRRSKGNFANAWQTPLGYAYNAIDLEAWPDGLTAAPSDATAALQFGLDWMGYNRLANTMTAGRGVINLHLPHGYLDKDSSSPIRGTYLISSELKVGPLTTVTGDGAGKTIVKLKNGVTTAPARFLGQHTAGGEAAKRLTIRNLTIDGGSPGWSSEAPKGIAILNSEGVTIENVEFLNWDAIKYGPALYLEGCPDVRIRNVTINGEGIAAGAEGIHLKSCERPLLEDCVLRNSTGVTLEDVTDGILRGNRISTKGGANGIQEAGGSCARNLITGNNVSGSGGIDAPSTDSIVTSNIL